MTVAYERLTFPNDVFIKGNLAAGSMTIPDNTVRGSQISSTPADAIPASKQQRGIVKTYSQEATAVAAVERKIMHVCRAAGTLVDFGVGCVTLATGTGNAVFTLRKNGSAVLSGSITIDSGNTGYVVEAALGFSSTTLAAGDVLEFECISSAVGSGTKPVGVFAQLVLDETYA